MDMKAMHKVLIGGLGIVFFSGAVTAQPPDDTALQRQTQQALRRHQPAGERRFIYMRYFMPTEQFARPHQNINADYKRAVASYLVNMYVSTRLYGEQSPAALSLNYLGVSDGFERLGNGFDFTHATRFYEKHQSEINDLFTQYLQTKKYPWPLPSQAEITQWLSLLKTSPKRERQIAFTFPAENKLARPVAPQAVMQLTPLLAQAQAQARKQAITYDEPGLELSDFDSHIGNHTYRRKRTYRWVKDECNYSSYLIAKQLTHALVTEPAAWENTHLYLLTATPAHGEFLTPAQGHRFKLADGSDGLHWRYHTAVLVIFQKDKQYFPIILDSFLAGNKPVSLGTWLTHFNPQTVFRAQPFLRSKTIEEALKIPTRLDGNTIWADGKQYQPAQVLR